MHALSRAAVSQEMLECRTYGKRPAVTTFLGNVDNEDCEQRSTSTTNIGLAWALVRTCPTYLDAQSIVTAIHACKNVISDRQGLQKQFQELCQQISRVQGLLTTFRSEGQRQSHLFAFWATYMDMVHILHDFIRAEREGNWLAHLSYVARMAPYFVAMDRCNYARWLPVYLADMHQVPQKHPAVFEQFMNGEHTVSRSSQPFSQVWSDMALEQSINLDSKKKDRWTDGF